MSHRPPHPPDASPTDRVGRVAARCVRWISRLRPTLTTARARVVAVCLVHAAAASGCGPRHGQSSRDPGTAGGPHSLKYSLVFDAPLATAELEVCSDQPLGTLELADPAGARASRLVASLGPQTPTAGGALVAGDAVCARVTIDVGALDRRHAPGGLAPQGTRALLLDTDQLLWAPTAGGITSVSIDVRASPAHQVLTPWSSGDAHGAQALDRAVVDWAGFLAVGSLERARWTGGGVPIDVAILPGAHAATLAEIERWLVTSADTAGTLLGGRLPSGHVSVFVLPVGPSGAPVPFGMLRRGGGASVMLLLAADARQDRLVGDWVAIHELLHIVLPLLRPEDAWLSEGFASYYTETLRARVGLQPALERDDPKFDGLDPQPRRALVRLAEGFARARAHARDATLAEASRKMHAWHAYQHVYWGGAAALMEMDAAVREASAGAVSLDDLLTLATQRWSADDRYSADEVLADCQRAAAQLWSAQELAGMPPSLQAIVDHHLENRGGADLDRLAATLGLDASALVRGALARSPAAASGSGHAAGHSGGLALLRALFEARNVARARASAPSDGPN